MQVDRQCLVVNCYYQLSTIVVGTMLRILEIQSLYLLAVVEVYRIDVGIIVEE